MQLVEADFKIMVTADIFCLLFIPLIFNMLWFIVMVLIVSKNLMFKWFYRGTWGINQKVSH